MTDLRLFLMVFPWLALGLLLVQLWVAGSLTIGDGATAGAAAILGALVAHWADRRRDERREQREDALRFLDVRREAYARFNKVCRDLLWVTFQDPHDVDPRIAKIQEAAEVMYQIELIAPDHVLARLVQTWDVVRGFAMARAEGTIEEGFVAASNSCAGWLTR